MREIKRYRHFQQVVILKCRFCSRWQGMSTTRTQEQLNYYNEQKRLKTKSAECNFCHKRGMLIDIFQIKGICSNQEATRVIKEKNNSLNKPVEDLPGFI